MKIFNSGTGLALGISRYPELRYLNWYQERKGWISAFEWLLPLAMTPVFLDS